MKPHVPLFAALLVALPAAAQESPVAQEAPAARADFVGLEGDGAGTANLRAASSTGLLIELDLQGLPPDRWVAAHVHETGACDPADAFESAGPHFNPAEAAHGYRAVEGPHAGDLSNQWVDAEGRLRAQIFAPLLSLAAGESDVHGRSIVIHAGPDDYASQPAGGAGDRLACGVVQ